MLPIVSGIEVCRQIRRAAPTRTLPVIMLTARTEEADRVRGLNSGADDYIVKPFSPSELIARLRAVIRRSQPSAAEEVLRYADLTMDTSAHFVRRGSREILLTAIEYKLLQEFLLHPRQVLSKDVLLDRVWGFDFGGNGNVVEVYVKQVRQKLEADGEQRLIHTIRNAGYVLREE